MDNERPLQGGGRSRKGDAHRPDADRTQETGPDGGPLALTGSGGRHAQGGGRMRLRNLATLGAVIALVAGACTSSSSPAPASGASGGGSGASQVRIVFVTHGTASSNFWNVVLNGANQAQKDLGPLGVKVDFTLPDKFDIVQMAQRIDAAVASKPQGIVVSIADASALGPHITAAVQAGIPVISINSGTDVFQQFGVLAHVGSDDAIAGYQAGQRMGKLGVKKGLCVNDEPGNVTIDTRCQQYAKGLQESGADAKVLSVPAGDPTGDQKAVEAALQADPSIDNIITQGPDTATPTLKALKEINALGKVKMATFDLGPDTLNAVASGDIAFAIDQQQYLQGYLPVELLYLYNKYLVMPGAGGVILTGPNFVTKDTASRVLELSQQGIR
jgi:simple sugar transport system substrate-binding protein